MKCSQCGEEMYKGFIRVKLFVVPFIFRDDKLPNDPQIKLNPLISAGPYLPLSKTDLILDPEAEGFYCNNCKQVIVPVKDFKKNKLMDSASI